MADRRDMLALLGAALLAGGVEPANAKMTDAVLSSAESNEQKHPFGVQHVYYSGATDQLKFMEAGSLRLNPGQKPHEPHQHPEEEFLLVTEGRGEILLNGKITQAGPGSIMYSAGNHLHGIENTGKEPMLFYYFKWAK